jgi:integrase
MTTQALTDSMVRAATAPTGKRLEITDARCVGLTLRVTDRGVKTFAFTYCSPARRKMTRLTLGKYPDVSLSVARAEADKHRAAVAQGDDPQLAKIEARQDHPVLTFDAVAGRYVEEYAKPNKSSWKNDDGYLKRPRAEWGVRDVASITDDDVAALLETIAATAPVSANRTQSVLHKLFAWAKEPGRKFVTVNPCADMKRRGREQSKDRVLTDDEIRKLWHGLDDKELPTSRSIALALKMVLATMARPGMVAGATRAELVNLESRQPEWHMSGARMKNRKPFIVPLSKLATSIIREAMPDDDQLVVFPSKWSNRAAIARHSLSQGLIEIVEHLGMESFTPHDLRRTAATIARRAGAARDHVEALLAHTRDDVTGIYDRHDMLAEKREAADILEREIRRIIRRK